MIELSKNFHAVIRNMKKLEIQLMQNFTSIQVNDHREKGFEATYYLDHSLDVSFSHIHQKSAI